MPNVTSRLSIVASAVSNDPRSAPARSREAGFNGLLFDAFSTSLNIPELSSSGLREFRHVLSAQDQQLVGLRWDTGPSGLGPGADVDQALSRLDRVMEAAAGLASPLVVVDLGPLPEPPPTVKPKPQVTPEQAGLILLPTAADIAGARHAEPAPAPRPPDPAFVSQVDGALFELGRHADRYRVTVAFRSELASFSALERALQAAACPWFGVDLDPVAVLRDEWDLDEVFSRLGSFFRHVRARDAVRGADRRTKPAVVGQGSVNWGQLLSNLEGAGYASWITVDPTELADRMAAAVAARRHISMQAL
jgi:sugar phosphate isomerase/epimerase